jgi:hypothetical protein
VRRGLRWLRDLAADALRYLRLLAAHGPLGRTRAARALRLDRGRHTCHADEASCLWRGCPLRGAHGSPGAPSCYLPGAP